MDVHPTDEDLILLFYEEAPVDERAATVAHLAACGACRAQYEELQDSLALVSDADVPGPRLGFEDRIWTGVARELPAQAKPWSVRQLGPVLAWAATVAITVTLGYQWARQAPIAPGPPAEPPTVTAVPDGLQERVLLTALDQHFGQTETLLVELLNAPEAGSNELEFERAAADDLVSSGRLYRESAQQTGERRFADVLEDLESVLVEVARSPNIVAKNDVESWRTQIEDNGLLFKVRAVTHEIRERQGDWTPANKGAL